jgi:hypothetical protein
MQARCSRSERLQERAEMSERTNTDSDIIRKQQERDVGHPLDRDQARDNRGRNAQNLPDKGEEERRRSGPDAEQ